jgi:hypothetical protein
MFGQSKPLVRNALKASQVNVMFTGKLRTPSKSQLKNPSGRSIDSMQSQDYGSPVSPQSQVLCFGLEVQTLLKRLQMACYQKSRQGISQPQNHNFQTVRRSYAHRAFE